MLGLLWAAVGWCVGPAKIGGVDAEGEEGNEEAEKGRRMMP
jgi:hypothetical protein